MQCKFSAKLSSNSKSPIKFFTATGNLKSCFGVGNVNFRCMKVWRSYHVAKLLWRSYHVAKLLATVLQYLLYFLSVNDFRLKLLELSC